jgi:hypothetical protein
MNILQIVLTNTSTIDTSLPFLWNARQNYPDSKIVILYCVGNKKQVLRDSEYVDKFCEEFNVRQIDFSNFLEMPEFGRSIWNHIFKFSPNDSYPIKNLLKNPWKLFKNNNFFYVGMALRKKIEAIVGEKFISFDKIDQIIKPDLVLFDLREKTRFFGRDMLFDYLYKNKHVTFLLPHSPHDITQNSEVTSFDEKGEYFPDFCKYWIPYIYSKAYMNFPDRENDFVYLGYPAFDSKWIEFNRGKFSVKNKNKKCLLLIRNFFPQNSDLPDGEWFTVSYQSNLEYLNRVADAIRGLNSPIEIVIKPHPKASLPKTEELIKNSRLANWEISYESFYEQLNEIDFVISTFTTSLLIPQMYGIPTIIIEDYVQEYINRWAVLEKMYKGLSLYTLKNDNLEKKLMIAINQYDSTNDIKHLRKYFPDGNLDSALAMAVKYVSHSKIDNFNIAI